DDRRSRLERAPRLRIGDQVDVALSRPRLDVLQAVPLLGQRTQRLHQQPELVGGERQLARPRPERTSHHADDVTDVERAIRRERVLAQHVAARVHLEVLAAILDLEKSGLAEIAHGDDASRDAHGRRIGERRVVEPAEAGVHLTGALVRAEIVRIGGRRLRAQGSELPSPDHDLLVVVGHASSSRKSEGFTGCRRAGQGTNVLLASTRTSAVRALAPTRSTTTASASLRFDSTAVNWSIVPPTGDGSPGAPRRCTAGAVASAAGTAAALTR